MDEAQCTTKFGFRSSDIDDLCVLLDIHKKIVTHQRTTCSGVERLFILLKQLAYPFKYTDIVPLFEGDQTELCILFNYVLDFLYINHYYGLESWNQWFLQPPGVYPSTFADLRFSWRVVFYGRRPWPNVRQHVGPCSWGFIWSAVHPLPHLGYFTNPRFLK